MKTEFSKDQIVSALNRLEEAVRVMSEEQERGVAYDYAYLHNFIEAVFEFDFFQLKEDIEFIKDELVNLRK